MSVAIGKKVEKGSAPKSAPEKEAKTVKKSNKK